MYAVNSVSLRKTEVIFKERYTNLMTHWSRYHLWWSSHDETSPLNGHHQIYLGHHPRVFWTDVQSARHRQNKQKNVSTQSVLF